MVSKITYPNICPNYRGNCARVRAGIECPECGYPVSEAMFALLLDILAENDPGHTT